MKQKSRCNVITPWGKSDGAIFYTNDITQYFTPGHGGIKVCAKQNAKIPYPFRDEQGWYEEDCAAQIVWYFLHDEISKISDYEFSTHLNRETSKADYFAEYNKDYAKESLLRWYKAECAYYFKVDLTQTIIDEAKNRRWMNVDEKLKEYNDKLSQIKLKAGRNTKIEIGKTIVFDKPIKYNFGDVVKAEIVKYKANGKALKDQYGRLLKLPSKSHLDEVGYQVI